MLTLELVPPFFPRSGRIVVDRGERTNVPNIFAIGDVNTVGYQLTPLAIDAGKNLARRLYTADDCYVSLHTCLIRFVIGSSELRQMGSLGC